ncbi:hypothetical protein N802_02845 [Knoellia sinensis KCTC 19936]|uniref:Peptidase S1 domain-containing protein n=1 Tax=Knoellia sinensis KCTC 19936 TaxID=1385520 RepID=A0A0A0J6E2_9MICO|nr:hypothetical protein [Knoellia sinensis]KGN31622.1 hypothetical protein N802_02845 [Knoellia sinensis KCTC 19936]
MATQPEQAAQRAAIRPVKESVEDELLAKAGVVAVDIAEKETDGKKTGEQSIVVFVEKKKPKSKLGKGAAIPAEINGIKTDVQELVIELQPAYKLVDGTELFVDPADYPTLAGGISIGPRRSVFLSPPDVDAPGNYVFVGTLGAMVRDRATGATMALTNFHVACVNNTWSVGDRMVQPSLVDGGAPTGEFGSLTRAAISENIDGAVITVDASEPWTASVTGIGAVAGSAMATVGMAVQKRGRTTEHTFGTVQSTDFTVSVDYGSDVGPRTLRHQIRIDTDTSRNPRFSNSGDSGSVVQDMSRNVVGLLFAGATDGSMTFANPIQAALDELSVDLLVAKPLVTRPINTCFKTRLTSCLITRPYVACPPPRTRFPVDCLVTRKYICDQVTRPPICRPTRIPLCFSDEGKRPGPRGASPYGPSGWGDGISDYGQAGWGDGISDYGQSGWGDGISDYGQSGWGDGISDHAVAPKEAYWSGYLAALEEVDGLDADASGTTGSGSGGGA